MPDHPHPFVSHARYLQPSRNTFEGMVPEDLVESAVSILSLNSPVHLATNTTNSIALALTDSISFSLLVFFLRARLQKRMMRTSLLGRTLFI